MSSRNVNNDWSIELLRGVAALLVVVAHYHLVAGVDPGLLAFAFTGVDLFFVISGYVFAPYLFGKPIHIAAHLVRRFFRLYPLYVVALLCYAWLRWQSGLPVDHLLKHALFLHTLETREIAFQFNPAFWSLPPEVEYYLALPLLAALAAGWRTVAGITLGALLVHGVVARLSPTDPAATNMAWLLGFHLPGLLVEFMFGSLAWWVTCRRPSDAARRTMLICGLAAWLGLAALFVGLGDAGVAGSGWLRGNLGLLAALAYALMVVAWVGWVERPAAGLVLAATVLGNLSYGVYLFHNAAPLALQRLKAEMPGPLFALLCLAFTLLVAQLLHWVWEAPCRRLGRRLAQALVPTQTRHADRRSTRHPDH